MKTTFYKTILAIVGFVALATSAQAQDPLVLLNAPYVTAGQFMIALLSGLLLAVGFQIVLTALTTAIGFSSLPNMVKRAESPPYPTKGGKSAEVEKQERKANKKDSDESSDHDPSFPMVKITSAFGVWTMVTASISLFFACWLGIYLGVVANPGAAIVLGLVIWATFFTIAAILEVKSISTLVGSLTSAVATGVRAGLGAIGNFAHSSPEKKLQEVVDHTIDKVTHDLGRAMRDNDLHGKLEEFVDKLQLPELDFHSLRNELEELINDIEVEENYTVEDDEAKRRLVLHVLSRQSRFSKKDLAKAKSVFSQAKGIQKRGGTPSDKVMSAIDKLAPGDEEDGRNLRERVEHHLRHADREELDPKAIKRDIDRMIRHPSESGEILRNRLAEFDRETAKSILAERGDIDEERAEKIVATAEKVIATLKKKFASGKAETMTMTTEGRRKASGIIGTVKNVASAATEKAHEIPEKIRQRIENEISNYLALVDRPELSYDTLHRDFEKILDNPSEAPEVLRERLSELDRESLVAMLAARESVSQEQAERMADKAIEARDKVMKRLHKIELAAKEKYYQSRYRLLKELEHLRRTGAAAAWWLLGTAVVSAAAAAGGALFGYNVL